VNRAPCGCGGAPARPARRTTHRIEIIRRACQSAFDATKAWTTEMVQASGHSATTVARAAHGYEPTREAAMAALAKSWRRA
jgi:hypothetical protein